MKWGSFYERDSKASGETARIKKKSKKNETIEKQQGNKENIVKKKTKFRNIKSKRRVKIRNFKFLPWHSDKFQGRS